MSICTSINIEPYKLNYRACIPFYVMLDPDLSKNELALYGLIEQMEGCCGDVFYTKRTLAEMLGVDHEGKIVSKMLQKLKAKNYLKHERRQIMIKGKAVLMWCWNTIRGGHIVDDEVKEGGVAEIPQGGVAEIPQGGVAEIPPCKTLDLKALDLNVCLVKPTQQIAFPEYKAMELTGLSTMVQQEKINALKLACLSHDKCQQEFERILGSYDVTLEEVLEDCVSHYGLKDDAQYVSPQRFLTWIRRTNAEQKGYMSKKQVKANAAVARQTEFNDEEKELLQDLRYQRKNPELPPKLMGGELRKAEDLMLIADSLVQSTNITKKTIAGRPQTLASMLTRFTERVGIK